MGRATTPVPARALVPVVPSDDGTLPFAPLEGAALLPAPLPDERWRLAGLYGVIVSLHIVGWGLCLRYATACPSLGGLGLAAYLFGLRHGFDADHIAAIDDTVRYLMRSGQRPLGLGFFFALGHSSIVSAATVALVLSASAIADRLPGLQAAGAIVGTGVSAVFLLSIGLLNLRFLIDLVRPRRRSRGHRHERAVGRVGRLVTRSWHMYPVGLLFGLGFDTAAEVGLLAASGLAAGDAPVAAVLALPLLFAAGMSIVDTTDGVLMVKAYAWTATRDVQRRAYDIAVTGLSVVLALLVGAVELCQVAARLRDGGGRPLDRIASIDLGPVGYVVVGACLCAWLVVASARRLRRVARRVAAA